MRKSTRLFELLHLFRLRPCWRGADIAERLEVSLRTVYRDLDTLIASGVPIEGERGVGYILREPIFLPPLQFTSQELEALQFGMKLVQESGGTEMAEAAEKLLVKIDAVLPASLRKSYLDDLSVFVNTIDNRLFFLSAIRLAIKTQVRLKIVYKDEKNVGSERIIRPLHTEFWTSLWTCTAWCELRNDFRVFRIDRISSCENEDVFSDENGKRYSDYLANLTFQTET